MKFCMQKGPPPEMWNCTLPAGHDGQHEVKTAFGLYTRPNKIECPHTNGLMNPLDYAPYLLPTDQVTVADVMRWLREQIRAGRTYTYEAADVLDDRLALSVACAKLVKIEKKET